MEPEESEIEPESEIEKPSVAMSPGHPFPKDVIKVLESLYSRGMTGWGARHSNAIDVALQSTGLDLSQLKVSSK